MLAKLVTNESIDAIDVTRVILSRLNSFNAIDVTRVKCQMSNEKCQMSIRFNLLSGIISRVSPVIFEERNEVDGIIRTMRERLDCVYPLLWITMFNLTLEGQFHFVLAQRDKNQWQVLDLFSSPL